ncbi:hypothetical protein KXW88_004908, partial [Aspergillus fumigatus]
MGYLLPEFQEPFPSHGGFEFPTDYLPGRANAWYQSKIIQRNSAAALGSRPFSGSTARVTITQGDPSQYTRLQALRRVLECDSSRHDQRFESAPPRNNPAIVADAHRSAECDD